MDRPSYGDGAPVAAIATALSESALSVVRTSGSVELAARAFSRPERVRAAAGNSIVHGWVIGSDGARVDEVLASVFRAPRSYTGEDSVDFSCHGGVAAARAVLAALVAAGFREALPGEFTFRAFLNGKLDLTRAESVMELVGAKTDEARRRAIGRLSGDLQSEISSVKDLLLLSLAAAELYLDYSEDDGVGAEAEEAAGRLPDRASVQEAAARLDALASSYRMERLFRDGATVAVAGKPNAGKSSLFNRLVREERSIVDATPGTTRDWIEAWIAVEGVPLRLVDTAGLREADHPIERMGVERSLAVLGEADLVLYLVDGTAGSDAEDEAFLAEPRRARVIRVWTKADAGAGRPPEGWIATSARSGLGIAELASAMVALLEEGGNAGDKARAGIASERQKLLVDAAAAAVAEALRLDAAHYPLDLIAPELRAAVDALGEITGEVSTEDMLETMFGRFCVGK